VASPEGSAADPIRCRHLSVPRRMRYAVLGTPDRPSQVWFALHGYGQTAPRFLRYLRTLDDGTRLLVAPEGLHRHYLDHEAREVGASWMTSEDRTTDIEDYVRYLDRLQERVLGSLERAPETVIGLGFSQGVHTLARWLAFGEVELDAAVFWGSHLPPDLDPGEHADRFGGPAVHLVGGDADPHFSGRNRDETEGRLSDAGVPFRSRRFEGEHRLDREVLEAIAAAPLERG